MSKPTIGLLPLYLKLYDDAFSELRPEIDEFATKITSELSKRGLDVVASDTCRIKSEFEAAVGSFEKAGVDAIVTLHLAYSPSLESIGALAGTDIPVIILDTTPTFNFSPEQDPSRIMFNHGIHGVQDLCNLLIRHNKPFQIEAGHWEKSDVLDRVAAWASAAKLASTLRNTRVGQIGGAMAGMGDFAVPADDLRSTIGVEIVPCDVSKLCALMPAENDAAVAAEMADDLARFVSNNVDENTHRYTTRVGIAVRRWIEAEKLDGFTVNFNSIDSSMGLPTLPFLEASKAMARGKGYAGEGDVLTTALVGALLSAYPETTFAEMFCPDWEHDTVYLSHMGEVNIDLVAGRARLVRNEMAFLGVDSPLIAVGRLRGGKAVFVNLAPGPDNTYTLIVAPVEMQDVDGKDNFPDNIRGWFKPSMPVADFLEAYSCEGGTHHAAIVYGDVTDELARFGQMMGWDVFILG